MDEASETETSEPPAPAGAAAGRSGDLLGAFDPAGRHNDEDSPVLRALRAVRTHLGMEVAYASEFVGDESVFRAVDAPGLEELVKVGDTRSLDDVYCRHILAGRLPELIADTSKIPLTASMPITDLVPIGSHISVPIQLSCGRTYGMFCALSPTPDPLLNERDLKTLRAFAELAAFEIERDLKRTEAFERSRAKITRILGGGGPDMVFQPIFALETSAPIGFEALARFPGAPRVSPDRWFQEAYEVGCGVALEMAAIRKALAALPRFPAYTYIAVNAAPETMLSDELMALLGTVPSERVLLEITEQQEARHPADLAERVAELQRMGFRVAVDDTGAGYAGLAQILRLKPNVIKLDRFLVQSIDSDPARRSLAAAIVQFARDVGAQIVAEGVETEAELILLKTLGAQNVQGYFLGRPVTMDKAVAIASGARAAA